MWRISARIGRRVITTAIALTVIFPLLGTPPAAADDPVAIDTVSPQYAGAGASVALTGHGFSATPALNTVQLNGLAATVTAATATELTVTVPVGATSGPVTVTSPDGSATAVVDFYAPPTGFLAADIHAGQRLPYNAAIVAAVPTAGKIALLTVAGVSGHRLALKLASSTFGNNPSYASVSVIDPSGSVVHAPTGFAINLFVEPLTLLSTGTYTVLIDPQGTRTGQVSVTAYDVPADHTATLPLDATTSTVTTSAGQNAVLSFAATAGDKAFVQLASGTYGSNGRAYLRRPDGTTLSSDTSCSSSCVFDTVTLPVTGTYTVLIDPQDNTPGSIGVSANLIPADVTTTMSTNGTPWTATITARGQNAVASFSATAGQRLFAQFSGGTLGSSSNGRVYLRRPDGTTLTSSTSCGTSCVFDTMVLPTTGTYTVLLDPAAAATGALTMALITVPADVASTATVDGGPVTVSPATPGQNAVISFDGTTGQRIFTQLTGGTFGSSSNGRVYLRRPDGTTLASNTSCGTSCVFDTTVLPVSGTYTLLVDPANAVTGSITAAITSVPADATAALSLLGLPTSVSITAPGQNAVLSFDATAGQRVFLQFTGGTFGSTGNGRVYLRRPDGTTLASNTSCGTSCVIDTTAMPVTGTYTILLDPLNAAIGTLTAAGYTVTDTATSTTIGAPPVTLPLGTPGQNGTVTFSGVAGQRVVLQTSSVTFGASSAALSLKKPDGTNLIVPTYISTAGQLFTAVDLPTTGTYTILVDPQGAATGAVNLQVIQTQQITISTTPGTPTTVTTTQAGQNTLLTFAVTSGQKISVSLSGSTYGADNLRVSVIRPDGSLGISPTGSSFLEPTAYSTTGTYTLFIDPQADATGQVEVAVYAVTDQTVGATAGGGAVTGTVTTPGQRSLITFAATSGQRIAVQVSDSTFPAGQAQVSILKPNGTVQVSAVTMTGTSRFIDAVTLTTAGTYTVVLDPLVANLGGATVTVYNVPADATVPAGTSGVQVQLQLTVPGQNGNVTFDGVANQRIAVDLSANNFAPGSASAAVSVLRPNGTVLLSGLTLTSAGLYIDRFTLPTTGTYKVVVDPAGSLTDTINVRVFLVAADPYITPPNDGTFTPIVTGVGQNATVAFTGVNGRAFAVSLTNPSYGTGQVKVRLRDPVGIDVVAEQILPPTGLVIPKLGTANGTYLLTIDPQGGAVGQVVAVTQLLPENIVPLTLGGTTDTLTTVPNENGGFSFDLEEGERAWLRLSGFTYVDPANPDSDTMLTTNIHGPSGVSQYVAATGPGTRIIGPFTAPEDGTYTLRLNPYGIASGSVSAAVDLVDPYLVPGALAMDGQSHTITLPSARSFVLVDLAMPWGNQQSLVVDCACAGHATWMSASDDSGAEALDMRAETVLRADEPSMVTTFRAYDRETVVLEFDSPVSQVELAAWSWSPPETEVEPHGTAVTVTSLAPGDRPLANFNTAAGQHLFLTVDDVTVNRANQMVLEGDASQPNVAVFGPFPGDGYYSGCCGDVHSRLVPIQTVGTSQTVDLGVVRESGRYVVAFDPHGDSMVQATFKITSIAAAPAVNPAPVVTPVTGGGPTYITSDITVDTVWGPQGSPYIIDDYIYVQSHASLTLLPGTVVKFAQDQWNGIMVNGQLLSLGTPSSRVTITSARDDTAGGDSNGDGSATSPAPGDWNGISINPNTGYTHLLPTSVVDYTDFRYGGGAASIGQYEYAGELNADGSSARLIVSHSSFRHSSNSGMHVSSGEARGFVGVYDSTFASSSAGIGLSAGPADIIGNTFESSLGVALHGWALSGGDKRFWFNTAHAPVSAYASEEYVSVRYNSLLDGIHNPGLGNQTGPATGGASASPRTRHPWAARRASSSTPTSRRWTARSPPTAISRTRTPSRRSWAGRRRSCPG